MKDLDKKKGEDDILVRVDRQTAEEIKKISEEMETNIREATRWITWLARNVLGRKVRIEEGDEVLEISLKEYRKITKLELPDVPNASK